MGLRDFIRRHRNVFSYSSREVVGGPGNEDMLVEEKRSRGGGRRLMAGEPDPSYDEIADAEPPPDPAP